MAMTKTNEETAEIAAQRTAPVIPTRNFQWQAQGFRWREAECRLPAGFIAQDLQDHPTSWRNIQADRSRSLRRFDRVTLIAHDESWCVKDALVVDADGTKVVFAFDKVIKLPAREAAWTDGTYEVKWGGAGFTVYRTRDGVQMVPQFFETLEAAKAEAQRALYPAKVA